MGIVLIVHRNEFSNKVSLSKTLQVVCYSLIKLNRLE